MTPLSEAMAPKICRYCANATRTHCLADVPWYAVSLGCRSFREPAAAGKPLSDKALARRCLRALVETV
jgi:hypothetical protein